LSPPLVACGCAIFQGRREQPVDRRVGAPFLDESEIARRGEAIERLIPCPAGIGDDVGD